MKKPAAPLCWIPGDVTSKVDSDVFVSAELATTKQKTLKQLGFPLITALHTVKHAHHINYSATSCMSVIIFLSPDYVIRAT